jgi:hypothetical protein
MTLEGEEKHEDDASPRSKTRGTDSFLDELEAEGRRLEASLPSGAAGMSAADLIAAAVAGASDHRMMAGSSIWPRQIPWRWSPFHPAQLGTGARELAHRHCYLHVRPRVHWQLSVRARPPPAPRPVFGPELEAPGSDSRLSVSAPESRWHCAHAATGTFSMAAACGGLVTSPSPPCDRTSTSGHCHWQCPCQWQLELS